MVPSSPTDVNARMFLKEDQKRNGRKCGVKVACIHFVDEEHSPYNDLKARGIQGKGQGTLFTIRRDTYLYRSTIITSSQMRVALGVTAALLSKVK